MLAFYLDTFRAGTPGRYDGPYPPAGPDRFLHLAAQRSGELLVVSITDPADQQPDATAAALRASQAREQAARAEAETQRAHLHEVLMQLPAQVTTLRGPAHVFELVNPPYQQLFPNRPIQGRPCARPCPSWPGSSTSSCSTRCTRPASRFTGPGWRRGPILPVQARWSCATSTCFTRPCATGRTASTGC
ncbi:MAG: hypothetical protein WKG07_39700 [Hymenobacter sp.]